MTKMMKLSCWMSLSVIGLAIWSVSAAGQDPPVAQVVDPTKDPLREDKRVAAGMYVSLSATLIGAIMAVLPFFATIFVFLAERHRITRMAGWFAWIGVILSVLSVVFGGMGINDIAVPGAEGRWELSDLMFKFQTLTTFLAIATLALAIQFMVRVPKEKPA